VTIKEDYFVSECRAAQLEPRKRNSFLQLHLNRWVNQATAWIPVEWWDRCPTDFSDDRVRNLVCCAGLDMAQKHDLTAFVIAFREYLDDPQEVEVNTETGFGTVEKKVVSLNYRIHLLPRFWIPFDTMKEHEHSDKVPYSHWVDRGWVTATEGTQIDYNRVYKDILALAERFPMLKQGQLAYDPAFATDITQRLADDGFTRVEMPQNYTHFSEPCQIFETLVRSGRITHTGNRCMRWCVENAAIRSDDAGRIRPVKQRKSAKRIDGVIGAVMSIGRVVVQEDTRSVYETRGILGISIGDRDEDDDRLRAL
jgi:phage terminase large subunit-like protein